MKILALEKQKIHSTIERFFILSGCIILIATMLVGLYFNKFDEHEKRRNNLQKIHGMLSQLIVPSLIISDFSEVKRLLFMASSKKETYLVIDNDDSIIMPDYDQDHIYSFVSNFYTSTNDCKKMQATYRHIGDRDYLINCSILKNNDVLSNEKSVGVLLSFSDYKWFSFSYIIFYFIGILISLFIVLIFFFRKMLYRQLLHPLVTLKNSIASISMDYAFQNSHISEIDNAPDEIVEIKNAFERLLLNLKNEYNGRVEAEKMEALIDLAAGVAHDIRSPLIALDIIIKDIKNISEEQRIVIRNSANRINDIANNLLSQYSQKSSVALEESNANIKPELVSDLLMSLISEKRAKHRGDSIQFILNVEDAAYGKFSLISASSFNRVLSNLIDNSIEASACKINVSLRSFDTFDSDLLVITLEDDGCGISPESLSKIDRGEKISSKEKGHGLGLQNAIKTIESEWRGHFHIQSIDKVGTTINIKLPKVSIPNWFLSRLVVNHQESIVILDDDESIHEVWKKRFREICTNFNFIHFYNPQELLNWYSDNQVNNHLFLIDFEFVGCGKNGLNIIEELNISNRSFLVTSRHEDLSLREYCGRIGLKIIPKTFAAYMPIELIYKQVKNAAHLIFIDDDIAISSAWKLHGLMKGKGIAVYNSVHDFKLDIGKFDLETPIYIDSDLKDEFPGQYYAKEFYEQGFKNIYLATGYLSKVFSEMYWIKEVVGKAPPF